MHCFEFAFNSADIKFKSGGKDCIKKGEFPSSPSLLTQKEILECIIMQSWALCGFWAGQNHLRKKISLFHH